MSKEKRRSYTATFKLDVINYAKQNSNRAAAREYNIDHAMVKRWCEKEEKFKVAKASSRRVGSGQKAAYPLAEDALKQWIDKLRNEGIAVMPSAVKFNMSNLLLNNFSQHYPDVFETFRASNNWFYRFMNQYDLSLHRQTKLGQKLPQDLQEKVLSFHTFIKNARANQKPNAITEQKQSLLTLDAFKGHLTDKVKEKCAECNMFMGVIPEGLTSLVQPFDVSINKPFKDRLREKWRTWMTNGEFQLTRGGNFKKPVYNLMCQWIVYAWEDIPSELVKKSFKKCGIMNELDGSEDYLMYKEEDNSTLEEPFIVLTDNLEENQEN
ncbi:18445_t:CDS:2, partial [Racocetra fulgida]